MNYACSKCGSENTQKLSSIVTEGTTHGYSKASGWISTGQTGVTRVTTQMSTTNRTALAHRFAQPVLRKPDNPRSDAVLASSLGWGLLCGFGASIMISGGNSDILLFGTFAVGFFGGYSIRRQYLIPLCQENAKYNKEVYPAESEIWHKSFYCHRCEFVFAPSGDTGTSTPFEKEAQKAIATVNGQLDQLKTSLDTNRDSYR